MHKTVKRKGRKSLLDNELRVESSLPPAVTGQLRCFLAVEMDCIAWKVKNHPKDIQVRLKWWGEMSDGTMFWPTSRKASAEQYRKRNAIALFPVCSGPKQFAAYLHDMNILVLDVLHAKTLKLFGKVEIQDIAQLSGSNLIDRWFPVTSLSVQPVKFADLHVVLKFEPVDVAGQDLPSHIPVIDQHFKQNQNNSVDSGKNHRRLDDILETTEFNHEEHRNKSNDVDCEDVRKNQDMNEDDVITTLIKRGKTLRDSIVESTINIDGEPVEISVESQMDHKDEETDQRTVPGSLLKEILKYNEAGETQLIPADTSLPIDLILQDDVNEEKLMYESTSSLGSVSDGPEYDETLLQDLFYTSKVQTIFPYRTDDSNTESDIGDDNEKETNVVVDHDEESTKTENFVTKTRDEAVSTEQTVAKSAHESELFDSVQNHGDRLVLVASRSKSLNPGLAHHTEFLNRLGVNKLTALGRVTAARITIHKLIMKQQWEKEQSSNRTYFIEYEFPVAPSSATDQKHSSSEGVSLEITRMATRKTTADVLGKLEGVNREFSVIHGGITEEDRIWIVTQLIQLTVLSNIINLGVVFNHHSVFPVFFDSNAAKFWWNYRLKMKVFQRKSGQKCPVLMGVGHVCLKNVLTSRNLQYEGMIDIQKQTSQDKIDQSSSSGLFSSMESLQLGQLELRIDLISNGKDLNFQLSESEKELEINLDDTKRNVEDLKKYLRHENEDTKKVEQQLPPPVHISKTPLDNRRRSVTLMTLLWITEGRNIVEDGHGFRVSVPGTTTRSNFYLISRMFWTNDTSRSSICWGQNEPHFNFRQVSPVLLTSALLDRMHNNFITLEVWNKTGGVQDDELIGIVKLPLQQLYLSYKEEQITEALLKSKFPVIAVDGWVKIKNPFKDSCQGELRLLLAMGSDRQVARLQDIKQFSVEDGCEKLWTNPVKERSQFDASFSRRIDHEKQVQHYFEIVVQSVRKLFAFEKTLWGETDCFVQYNFPYQRPDIEAATDYNEEFTRDIPGLQNHRTPTTLCVPDTTFNDMARYCIVLPNSLPVQRFLLAAFHGSWSNTGINTVTGITFELWKRHYYPNIRDQLVAKGVLPLAKLCGMITMQKPGEGGVQSFSLPLTILPSSEEKKSEHGGLLDITIKYRQSKLAVPRTQIPLKSKAVEENTQVCLSIEISRACGLKCALKKLAEKDSSLTYASEVGGNPFVSIKLPFNVSINERATRTIARTFTPEFGYRMEFVLPLHFDENVIGNNQETSGTLAECLEAGKVLFEVWHQRARETCEDFGRGVQVHGFLRRQFTPTSDVLLGVVKIPLQPLLFSHTGIKGWFPIHEPKTGWENEDHARNVLDSTVGGLEIRINFGDGKDREKIIDCGRAMGWSSPLWYEMEDGQWLNDTVEKDIIDVGQALSFEVVVKNVWIPKIVFRAMKLQQGLKDNKMIGCYIRYKFYDSKPVFSAICGLKKVKESEVVLCTQKHSHSYLVKTTAPFIWYMREEKLEIQVWLTSRNNEVGSSLPNKRDKLVGSAFLNLFPLLDGRKKHSELSDLYPLFRSSAVDLAGAGIHVRLVLQKPSNSKQVLPYDVDEDIVSTEHNSSIIHDNVSIMFESSDENENKPHEEKYEEKQDERLSSHEDDHDTIAAHVIVEQALHLPSMKTTRGESIPPDVFVTYQPTSNSKPVKTKVIPSSTSPLWGHEKIIKFRRSEISRQVLTFKVWHSQNCSGQAQSTTGESTGDVFVGCATVELSPLASGFRQVVGWYNIVDFSGQCKGQIKVGVIPVLPVSRRSTFPELQQKTNIYADHALDEIMERPTDHLLNQPTLKEHNIETSNSDGWLPSHTEASESSKSFLFRQLRKNMSELDTIKDRLKQRLMNTTDRRNTDPFFAGGLVVEEHKMCKHKTKVDEDHDDSIEAVSLNPDYNKEPPANDAPNILKSCNLSSFEQYREHCVLDNLGINNNDELHQHRDSDDGNKHGGDYDTIGKFTANDCDHNGDNVHYYGDDNGYDDKDNHGNSDGEDGGGNDDRDNLGNSDDGDGDRNGDNGGDDLKNLVEREPEHSNIDGDTEHNDQHDLVVDRDANANIDDEPSDRNEATPNSEMNSDHVKTCDEESLDSFFDCFFSKQNERPRDGMNDITSPQSVVTRRNLEKLKDILNENEDNQHIPERTSLDDESSGRGGVTSLPKHDSEEKENSFIEHGDGMAGISQGSQVSNEIESKRKNQTQKERVSVHERFEEAQKPVSLLDRYAIPNFFMPPKYLEQSMRSLRLAATFRKEPRQDMSERKNIEDTGSVEDEIMPSTNQSRLAASFKNWKQLAEIRTTGKVPISSKETSRLARIFSSTYSAFTTEEN